MEPASTIGTNCSYFIQVFAFMIYVMLCLPKRRKNKEWNNRKKHIISLCYLQRYLMYFHLLNKLSSDLLSFTRIDDFSREGLWTTLSWSFWLILQRSGHYSTCSVPTIIYSVTFVIVTLYHMNIICFDYNVLCRFRNLLSRFAQSHYVVCTMRQHITVYTAT